MKISTLLRCLPLAANAAAVPANTSLTSTSSVSAASIPTNITFAMRKNSVDDDLTMNHTSHRFGDKLRFFYHENYVAFEAAPLATNGLWFYDYKVQDFFISPGQDPKIKNSIGDVHTFWHPREIAPRIIFWAGRHGSKETANWWNDRIGWTHTSFGHKAHKLNFAFIGTLRGRLRSQGELVEFAIPDLGLAQGHSLSTNNWWIGAAHSFKSRFQPSAIDIPIKSPPACFTFRRGDDGNRDQATIYVDLHRYEDCF